MFKLLDSSVQSPNHVWLFLTPWTAAHQVSLFITNSQSLFKLMSIESVMPTNHLVLCRSLLLLPSIFASTRLFYNESAFHIRQPSIGASGSVFPMNIQDRFPSGWTGWISLQSKGLSRIFSNTTVQKHLLWCSAFFLVQLSHPYMTTGKTITLTRRTFVGKVMSLLFNMLLRLVIAFLPRSKCLNFMAAVTSSVILEPPKIVCYCFHCFPIYFPWSDGTGCHELSFLNVEKIPQITVTLIHSF